MVTKCARSGEWLLKLCNEGLWSHEIECPVLLSVAVAAPGAARDDRVDLFGGIGPDSALEWGSRSFDTTRDQFYGVGVDRLDVLAPGFDVGLEYKYSD